MTLRCDDYPSRAGGKEYIFSRKDPVVYGEGRAKKPYQLNPAQIEQYERNGFLVIPGLFEDWVDDLLAELPVLKKHMAGREELYTEPDNDEVRTIFKPYAYSKLIDRLSRDPRILQPVEQILGSKAYIMQSCINVKPAFKGKSFPWHSDFETWHVEDGMPRMRALTAWVMLTENTSHNGPLYVIPGSHQLYISCAGKTEENNYKTSLKHQVLGVPQSETMKEVLSEKDIQGVYGKPGTLVFHECNLLHGSPDNISADPRSILMFVYNSVENACQRPFSGLPPRPHYLSNPDREPLYPCDNQENWRAA